LLETLRRSERSEILKCHRSVSCLCQIDFFSLSQCHDRLLPMRAPSEIGPSFSLLLAGVLACVYSEHFLSEEFLDRSFDLELVCPRIDPKYILIMLLAKQASFLRQADILNQVS
jgi:hypothetical protein